MSTLDGIAHHIQPAAIKIKSREVAISGRAMLIWRAC
jgi:hypothetical protein